MTFHLKHPGPSPAMTKGTSACPDVVMVKCSAHTAVGGLGPTAREAEIPAWLNSGPTGNPCFVIMRPEVEISWRGAFFPSS